MEGHSADGAGLELRWSQNKSHVTVDIIVNCTDDYSVEFELDRLHFHCMGHPDTNPGANYSIHPVNRLPHHPPGHPAANKQALKTRP